MPASKAESWKPTVQEVLAAASSLYDDELKPFGRILLKRLRERQAVKLGGLATNLEGIPLIDPKHLRQVCSGISRMMVQATDTKEYVALLRDRAGKFVDPLDTADPFPGGLWHQAEAYFASARELPCGRYACALELMRRRAPFLEGRSVGEVCHIVQLAISQRGLLGYSDGHLVPYHRSEAFVKANSASQQRVVPEGPVSASCLPVATWGELRWGLRHILVNSKAQVPNSVTLSNVKRLFRSELQLELSETSLGHSRVQELLLDARLRDICRLEYASASLLLVHLVTDYRDDSPRRAAPFAFEAWASPYHFRGFDGHAWAGAAGHASPFGYCASDTLPAARAPTPPGDWLSSPWPLLSTKPVAAQTLHRPTGRQGRSARLSKGHKVEQVAAACDDTEVDSQTDTTVSPAGSLALWVGCAPSDATPSELGSWAPRSSSADGEDDAADAPPLGRAGLRYVVKNTFVHVDMGLEGAAVGAGRRCRSAPPRRAGGCDI